MPMGYLLSLWSAVFGPEYAIWLRSVARVRIRRSLTEARYQRFASAITSFILGLLRYNDKAVSSAVYARR